jgi:hypothetical protein
MVALHVFLAQDKRSEDSRASIREPCYPVLLVLVLALALALA